MISRTEKVQWMFKVSGEMYKENHDLFSQFDVNILPADVADSDTVNLNYKFYITYIEDICKSLEAIVSLRGRGVPCEVIQEELLHGRCLIQQVFDSLEELSS